MNEKNFKVLFFISIIILIILFCVALVVGRFNIPLSYFGKLLTAESTDETAMNVIFNLRLPRTIAAGLAGTALSLSGLIYQEIFQNKLVSPDLLGVSSGAGVGAAFSIMMNASSVIISLSSFFTGITAVFLTWLISSFFRNKSSVILLLAGVIVSGFMNSLLSLCKYFASPDTTLSSIIFWLMGSFADVTMNEVKFMLPVISMCSAFLLFVRWRINIVALGREDAQMKGINYVLYRTVLIVLSTILTAVTVAFCGVISWVGLVIPHITRLITSRDTSCSIPFTITFGGSFMIFTDILSRVFTADEIPVSAVTGLLGTLVFVIILFHNRGKICES